MKKQNNFYVVWVGNIPGIYKSWKDCELQINGYPNAKYKGFKTIEAAKTAYEEGYEDYWGKDICENTVSKEQLSLIGKPILESISVDAAWNTSNAVMEYQGVKTDSREVLFKEGPFEDATNNVGEFLAIVHGLAFLKKQNSSLPIYSDSRNAINWVRNKKHRSNLIPTKKNKKVFELLERAEKWLEKNNYTNKILKWETGVWGENPADFGRK